MSILSKIIKIVRSCAALMTSSDPFKAQHNFNNFAIETIFSAKEYEILDRVLKPDPKNHQPAFTFRDKANNLEFYLIPKFSTRLYDGKIMWCTLDQWQAYTEYDAQKPVFLLLGTGQNSSIPSSISLIPFHAARVRGMYPFYTREFAIPQTPLSSNTLWARSKIVMEPGAGR